MQTVRSFEPFVYVSEKVNAAIPGSETNGSKHDFIVKGPSCVF